MGGECWRLDQLVLQWFRLTHRKGNKISKQQLAFPQDTQLTATVLLLSNQERASLIVRQILVCD